MDFEEKIRSGYYTNRKPYATRKSNPEVFEAYQEESSRLYEAFKKDLRYYIEGFLGPLSDDQSAAVFSFVWSEGHSGGYNEVLNYTMDIINLLEKFVEKH